MRAPQTNIDVGEAGCATWTPTSSLTLKTVADHWKTLENPWTHASLRHQERACGPDLKYEACLMETSMSFAADAVIRTDGLTLGNGNRVILKDVTFSVHRG